MINFSHQGDHLSSWGMMILSTTDLTPLSPIVDHYQRLMSLGYCSPPIAISIFQFVGLGQCRNDKHVGLYSFCQHYKYIAALLQHTLR